MINKGHENLIPVTHLTKAEQRKLAKKAGLASVEAKRKNKLILQEILELKANNKVASKIAEVYGVDVADISLEAAMDFMQVTKAIQSKDTQAYNAVKDRVYGKPKQEIQQHNTHEQGSVLTLNMVKSKDVTKTEDTES
jgi:hypothetical protein